jgi:hypothetical protein
VAITPGTQCDDFVSDRFSHAFLWSGTTFKLACFRLELCRQSRENIARSIHPRKLQHNLTYTTRKHDKHVTLAHPESIRIHDPVAVKHPIQASGSAS